MTYKLERPVRWRLDGSVKCGECDGTGDHPEGGWSVGFTGTCPVCGGGGYITLWWPRGVPKDADWEIVESPPRTTA